MGQAATAAHGSRGRLVVVVGPSGAGKDTLMDFAARRLSGSPDLVFVRRVITRDGDAGGEDHEAVTEEIFEDMAKAGGFAVSWNAHGLRYGIPAETLQHIIAGRLAIANGSRSALPHFRAAFPLMVVINVTARPEVLAARLEGRGRETREEIFRRLQRASPVISGDFEVVTIDNSGSLDEAGEAMVAVLKRYLPVSADR
nr:phosphonate metabolism protein/1,5-bisphosphokinase (PRPP-forming) PhnN [Rhizobium sp. Q54]